MASLFVIQGRDQGRRLQLETEIIRLGRDSASDFQVHDTEVSRKHAELRANAEGGFTLVDLGSSNGTFINDERVERHELRSGDRLQVGRTLMIFTGDDEPENLSGVVDIRSSTDGSRIVRSLSQEESNRLLEGQESDSPWLARARSNLQVMYRTALAVSHTLDIDQLLQRILELIFEWVEADRGCVMLIDDETNELIPRARHKRSGSADNDRIFISRTILDYVMEHKEGVVTSDAQDDARWDAGGSIVSSGIREAVCVPMQGRYGMVGVVYIDTYTPPGRAMLNQASRRFTEEHLKLMIAIGHQAALAVEDTSYYSAMVQAERLAAVGQTIAVLSHHIKNILQGIRGGSYLIEEGLKADEAEVVRRGWTIVEKNQEKISNLVLDMLSYSKDRRPDLALADLNVVCSDVVELMEVRADDYQVELSWAPAEEMPEFAFDADAMHRAILNVVTNAIDACRQIDEGRVTLSTGMNTEKNCAWISVEDNGEGIAPEDLRKIFNVFESRKGARGTGLGLPVTEKIVREHGGEVRVTSQPSEGSQFLLELPALPSEADSSDSG